MKSTQGIFVYDTVRNPLHQRGVERCFANFTLGLARAVDFGCRVYVYSKRRRTIPNTVFIPTPSYVIKNTTYDLKAGNYLSTLFGKVVYSPFYGNINSDRPKIYTVYDFIHEKFPQYFPHVDERNRRFISDKSECFKNADILLPISQSTKKDLLELYPGIPESKLHVLYLGIDHEIFRPVEAIFPGRPYILYVGNRTLYKNFLRLLKAYAISRLSKDVDLRVVSPVASQITDEEKEIIQAYRLADRVVFEYPLSEADLCIRYAQAKLFVFPSEYEGFGLPLLEAMSCGVLVASSNTSSMPEIGGDALLYFDPFSVDSMMDVLKKAMYMPESDRKDQISKGCLQASRFSWEKSQSEFVEVVRKLI